MVAVTQNLAGHIAIISGGLGDIGFAIAVDLASRGADIALGDIKPTADANEQIHAIISLGRQAIYTQVDVSDHHEVNQWIGSVTTTLGTPTLIVPNAAVVSATAVCDLRPEQWHQQMAVNLNGAFFLAQACAARLRDAQQHGRIVFIGSWAAHAPHVNLSAYCISKAALRMLCKSMALELAPLGILVNEVAPGYVDAGLSALMWKNNPSLRAEAESNIPAHHLISPAEVAVQVAHLCDPENHHITGTTLLMDGGLSLTNIATKIL